MTMLCTIRMVLPVCASQMPEVSVPVTVSLSGTLPEQEESFTINLKADRADIPMPQESKNGVYTMIVKGAGTQKFPAIHYDRVGVYTYTIYQTAGIQQACNYDQTLYRMTVTVSNKEDGSGLEATAVLREESKTEKISSAEFHNTYETKTEEIPESETPEQPQEKTESVESTTSLPTGDHSHIIVYVLLLIGSVAAVVFLLVHKDKNQEEA